MNQYYLVPPVAGPMANSLDTVEYFTQSLLDSNPWDVDPGCIPVPWRKGLAAFPSRKLRIGIVFDDGVVKPQPPIARLLRETSVTLKEAGHEGMFPPSHSPFDCHDTDDRVIKWDTALHIQAINLWAKGVLADGGQHCKHLCDLVGEPLIEGILVGTPNDQLSIPERELVSPLPSPLHLSP